MVEKINKGREKTIKMFLKKGFMAKLPNWKDSPQNVPLMHQNLLFNFGFVSSHYLTHNSRTTSESDLWASRRSSAIQSREAERLREGSYEGPA